MAVYSENNLKQMNKEWTAKLGERDMLVERIHNAGISIYASFVFGFDYDNEESFETVLEFSINTNSLLQLIIICWLFLTLKLMIGLNQKEDY